MHRRGEWASRTVWILHCINPDSAGRISNDENPGDSSNFRSQTAKLQRKFSRSQVSNTCGDGDDATPQRQNPCCRHGFDHDLRNAPQIICAANRLTIGASTSIECRHDDNVVLIEKTLNLGNTILYGEPPPNGDSNQTAANNNAYPSAKTAPADQLILAEHEQSQEPKWHGLRVTAPPGKDASRSRRGSARRSCLLQSTHSCGRA